jgi:hypothetical protein
MRKKYEKIFFFGILKITEGVYPLVKGTETEIRIQNVTDPPTLLRRMGEAVTVPIKSILGHYKCQ